MLEIVYEDYEGKYLYRRIFWIATVLIEVFNKFKIFSYILDVTVNGTCIYTESSRCFSIYVCHIRNIILCIKKENRNVENNTV